MAARAASALLALPAAAVADAATAADDAPTVIKRPLDPAQYRILRLDNGLTALLVSDPEADQAAAALDVHVGSGSDPDGWNGLAHFLEHMLFLGTEKYPRTGEYQQFIAAHGGRTNAYTALAHTNYHFEVAAAHLLPALDRFAQFFIAPTFDAAFVERERQVVHSEYQARREDEALRLWSARRQALNPAHPASRFTTGNSETLRDRDSDSAVDGDGVAAAGESSGSAREQLIAFHRRHYSANLMTLVVIGREPPAQLAHWVERLFAPVPNRAAELPRFDAPYFAPGSLPMRLDIRPQKEVMRLSFAFPIASTKAHFRSKPLHFVAALLGHEGEGSLLAHLKSRGWARELRAGAGYMDAVQGAFSVSLELTAEGLQRVDAIGELLFAQIRRIAARGLEEWRFDEARQLAEVDFRFAETLPPFARARRLAALLHDYPAEEALRGPYLLEEFRPDLSRALLADLRPDNVLVQVVAKDAAAADAAWAVAPYYDTEYAMSAMPAATLERWTRARDGAAGDGDAVTQPRHPRSLLSGGGDGAAGDGVTVGDGDVGDDATVGDGDVAAGAAPPLHLPPPNPFIPQRLTPHQFPTAPHTVAVPRRLQLPEAAPVDIAAWHLADPDFNAPRAVFFANFDTRFAGDSARRSALTQLFVRMVRRRLDAASYPALLAGLQYRLYRPQRGFSFQITGYADKQPALLAEVLRAIFAPHFDAGEFARALAALQRDWRNAEFDPPARQAARAVFGLLVEPDWSEAEKLHALRALTVADLDAHAAELLATAAVVTLAHGDVTRTDAVSLNAQVAAAFADAGIASAPAPAAPRLRKLPVGRAYLRSIDVAHTDSALVAYYQGAEKSDAERARLRLLAQLLQAPFFFDLRTTHRVGYLVHATPWVMLDVPALAFSVQSPSHAPAEIARLTDDFLRAFGGVLDAMPADEFAQIKRGLIERIDARDTQLAERAQRFWADIATDRLTFDSRRRMVAELESLSQDDMRAALRRVIHDSPRRLTVQSPGRRPQAGAGALGGDAFTVTGDPAEFRQTLRAFFPVD